MKSNPPALKVLDAGMGDGTVLTRTMRAMHNMFPTIPFLVVGKEISLEDVRFSIEKMTDRFHEHPQTVFVATNLYYYEVAGISPRQSLPADFNWQAIELEGSTTHEFDAQISDQLQPILSAGWRTRTSAKTGNPLYVKPSVVVIYRKDHRFALDSVIPRRGEALEFDFIMASQALPGAPFGGSEIPQCIAPAGPSIGAGRAHGRCPVHRQGSGHGYCARCVAGRKSVPDAAAHAARCAEI